MEQQSIKILYTLRLTHGIQKGVVINREFDIEELEEEDISDYLIRNGYYKEMGHPCDYYDIIGRKLIK